MFIKNQPKSFIVHKKTSNYESTLKKKLSKLSEQISLYKKSKSRTIEAHSVTSKNGNKHTIVRNTCT